MNQSSDEDEVREGVPSSLIKGMCVILREIQLFEEKYHPDTMLSNRAVHIFNDNAMMHFRNILQCRQKQLTLDKFLVKRLGKQLQRKKNCEQETEKGKNAKRRITKTFYGGDSNKKKVHKQIKYKIMFIIMHHYYVLLFCICIVY